jgi:hypothetical protein
VTVWGEKSVIYPVTSWKSMFGERLTLSGTSAAAFEIIRYARVPNSFRSVSELASSIAIIWLRKIAQK